MRLLVVTQAVDERDVQLGFFHRWIEALAKDVDSLTVICLKEGEHHLPANVRVYSLGKEKGSQSRIAYAIRFKKLVWRLRNEYDVVFVHMNQEYILIAGWLWKLLGKHIYMWRNHYDGSWLTDIAAGFCTKVFCTSMASYTAKYKKTVLMPVGVDTQRFGSPAIAQSIERLPRSILFLARIAPSKRPDILIDALAILKEKGIAFTASIYGNPLASDVEYYESLKEKAGQFGLEEVQFYPGLANIDAPAIYRAHEIFVNCSPSGMFDKTLFEAAACGCLVVASSRDFARLTDLRLIFAPNNAADLARILERTLADSTEEKVNLKEILKRTVKENALASLMKRLVTELR